LRRGSADALRQILQRGRHGRPIPVGLADYLGHALALIHLMLGSETDPDKDDARLLAQLVQKYDGWLTKDLTSERAIGQKIIEVCRRLLGEQDPDTLNAMND
jgi:hypothetical protein